MSIDPAIFRRIMGHFVTGVTVVTTSVDGRLHGMTANAVSSVSLEPLLLLVCIDKGAHAHQECAEAGRFAVNILTGEQEEIAHLFAAHEQPERGRLRGVPFHLGANGSPILDDCLAYLECDVVDSLEGGDHTIFIGKVLDGQVTRDAPPLIFYRGAYKNPGLD